MNKFANKVISMCLCTGMCLSGAAFAANDTEMVYGTMNIPYAEFFAEEGVMTEVDAVASCTNSKWHSDSFAAGAFYEGNTEDEGGTILGVVYPVAVSSDDLAALGDNNFDFTPLDEMPAAYKTVTLSEGKAGFSAICGEEQKIDANVVLNTATVWGDYELDIDAIHNKDGHSDIGTICGALLRCSDGSVYALRHLENIWLDELSWSCGIRTVEPHKNVMASEMYADMMGKTIQAITYITENGYSTIAAELYVPFKFIGGVEVQSVPADSGSAALTFDQIPDDFAKEVSVAGLETVLDGEAIYFTDALPGAYTLTMKDTTGKYADLTAAFTLTTEEMPAVFDAEECALVCAVEQSEDVFEAFIRNITTVTVNDTPYAASGRGAVAIIDMDGALDTEAVLTQGKGAEAVITPIFTAGETYSVTVSAAGFNSELCFEVTVSE